MAKDDKEKVSVSKVDLDAPVEPKLMTHPQQPNTNVVMMPEERIDEKDLYETDPKKCDERIIVNTIKRPMILPRQSNILGQSNSSQKLLRGDRAFGTYYKDMVTKNAIPGLQQACKLSKAQLEDLEEARKKRKNQIQPLWIQEAQAMRDESVVRKR